MKDRIARALQDYKKDFGNSENNKGAFYTCDVKETLEISGIKTVSDELINAIWNAMQAGFVIGYRCAKREIKNR